MSRPAPVTITAERDTWSYTDEGETDHIIAKGWTVMDGECQDIMDAPTRGKALFGSFLWGESDQWELRGFRVRRRKDLDGVTFAEARWIVWPCKERPCPGCPCCMDGYCHDDYDWD